MDESPVFFTMVTNIIYYDPRTYTVVPFMFVSIHLQSQCQARDSKGGQTAPKKFQAQRKA